MAAISRLPDHLELGLFTASQFATKSLMVSAVRLATCRFPNCCQEKNYTISKWTKDWTKMDQRLTKDYTLHDQALNAKHAHNVWRQTCNMLICSLKFMCGTLSKIAFPSAKLI
jgi:hypothetical protein